MIPAGFSPPRRNAATSSSSSCRSDGETDYIKRVIGLPGDKIQMIEGRLYINGEEVPREPIATIRYRGHFYGRATDVPTYQRDAARRGQP